MAPRERHAQVEEVGVLLRSRAEAAVGEHHRVRLAPRDLLARRRSTLQQVRRARERAARAELHVCAARPCKHA
eukprot:5870812-Prymnesium_polylepis.1